MADNQFVCPPCGEKFHTQEELASHAKDLHSNQTSEQEHSISCSKCGLKAKSVEDLKEHGQQDSMNG